MKEENGFKLISKYRGAIMGLSALMILFFHEWVALFEAYPKIYDVERYFKKVGFVGVDIFLFLSGIGLTFSIAKTSLGKFYYHRIKRIIIPFVVIAVFRLILEKWPIDTFWKNISGFNFYNVSIYSFLWFVPAILTLYLFFPLYYKLFSKSKNKVFFTLCVLMIWLILSIYFREKIRIDLFGFTNRIPIFVIGILVGWITQNKEIVFNRTIWAFLCIMLLLGIYLSYLTNFRGWSILVPVSNCCFPNMLIAISFSFLLPKFLDLMSNVKIIKHPNKAIIKILAFYGMFSLEVYCVQEWLGRLIFPKIIGTYTDIQMNIIMLIWVTVCGYALYWVQKLFWKPIDWNINKLTKKVETKNAVSEEVIVKNIQN